MGWANLRTLSYAALFGIRADLGLKGTEYSTLSSIFYIGWLAWAIPGNLLMAKFPISKYLGVNVSHGHRVRLIERSSSGELSSSLKEARRTSRIWLFCERYLVPLKLSPSLPSVSRARSVWLILSGHHCHVVHS
jgi:hypothetical protein